MSKDIFCSKCGARHVDLTHPKECRSCGEFAYINPIPVICAVVPIFHPYRGAATVWQPSYQGILLVRRGINPCKGELCLPGGFMDDGEGPAEAASREVFEETGVSVHPNNFELLSGPNFPPIIKSPSSSNLLVFVGAKVGVIHDGPFNHDHEVQEVLLTKDARELCWSTHTAALKTYIAKTFPHP